LFDVKRQKEDLTKIETCRRITELYVKVYFEYFCICWR